jgi:hypothetical protein
MESTAITTDKNVHRAMTEVIEMAAKVAPASVMKRAIAVMSAITMRATFPPTLKATPMIVNPASSAVATDVTETTAAMIADLARTKRQRQRKSTTQATSQETLPHRLRLLNRANHAALVTAMAETAHNVANAQSAMSPMPQ